MANTSEPRQRRSVDRLAPPSLQDSTVRLTESLIAHLEVPVGPPRPPPGRRGAPVKPPVGPWILIGAAGAAAVFTAALYAREWLATTDAPTPAAVTAPAAAPTPAPVPSAEAAASSGSTAAAPPDPARSSVSKAKSKSRRHASKHKHTARKR